MTTKPTTTRRFRTSEISPRGSDSKRRKVGLSEFDLKGRSILLSLDVEI